MEMFPVTLQSISKLLVIKNDDKTALSNERALNNGHFMHWNEAYSTLLKKPSIIPFHYRNSIRTNNVYILLL